MGELKRHIAYARYLARHKWFVFRARKFAGLSVLQALVHDASKFLPSEWVPYAETFYNSDGTRRKPGNESDAFARAWNHHQKRNKHHWQYWWLRNDNGSMVALEMPGCYVSEMLADWIGAGLAISGKSDTWNWYETNKDRIELHPATRARVEFELVRLKEQTCG